LQIPLLTKFFNFSHKEGPVGRGHTFVSGDISTCIRFITKRHLLFPTSQSCKAVAALTGRPPNISGALQGFQVPLQQVHEVRHLL